MSKKVFKYDINFFEFPMWVVDKKTINNELIIKKDCGTYTITSSGELPSHFDVIVLYYLLTEIHKKDQWKSLEIRTTRNIIAKEVFSCFKEIGSNHYAQIWHAIERWKWIDLKFDGIFYEDKHHTTRLFGVIEDVILNHKTKELYIRFNQQFIQQIDQSSFYKYVNFDVFKKLTRATSARLYEILSKSFLSSDKFPIGLDNLAEKLTLGKRNGVSNYYPSDVLKKLKIAVADISKKTDLKISFSFNKEDKQCTFTSTQKHPPSRQGRYGAVSRRSLGEDGQEPKINLASDNAVNKTSHHKTIKPAAVLKEKKVELPNLAKQIEAAMEKFNAMPLEEQKNIRAAIKKDKFLNELFKNEEARIYTYMTSLKILSL